jgi:RimJ/RimL family protein N-acetyltransferase
MSYVYCDGIESERLISRFIVAEDAKVWTDFMRDDEAARFMSFVTGGTPEARAETWMAFTLKRYAEHRYGLQALIEKNTANLIGQCGLILQELGGKKEIEVGYHLLPEYWGKGYATEAARAFRDYGFKTTTADYIISIIDPANERSKKVAKRNGMSLSAARQQCLDGEYDIFKITRAEWEAL